MAILRMFVCLFSLRSQIEKENVLHMWLSQKVQSNSENQRVHKLLLLTIWFSLGWLNRGPQ